MTGYDTPYADRVEFRTYSPEEDAADQPLDVADHDLAEAWSRGPGKGFLYVKELQTWLEWDGTRWRPDRTDAAFDSIRNQLAKLATATNKPSQAATIKSVSKASAVERFAKASRVHARRPEDFDADPWVLNTPDGTVDLRTGKMRPHKREDMLSKRTTVGPAGDCPLWKAFLWQMCEGNADVVAYLQRWAGYCLTGLTTEQAFAFFFGPGGNGKGIFLKMLCLALAEYAMTAMMETFTASNSDRHPADLASLRGARLVTAQETEEGRAWAEARIKALTGGDVISARVMRGDPFEFTPIFKLLIAGNHRPPLRNPDAAMRRRLHLVPCNFVPPKPDPDLAEKLRAELPGILAWMIEGCLAWQRHGLTIPTTIKDATAEYFDDQDRIGAWLAERCDLNPSSQTPSRALFTDWKQWATERGDNAGSEVRFSDAMVKRFAKQKTRTGAVFSGLRLKPSETGAWN